MPDPDRLVINSEVSIPLAELEFHFVRSSGPGGQHVNKSATQVELTFDVPHSPSLSEPRRKRIQSALKTLIDKDGVLHLESQSTRSQLRNREDVIARFQSLLRAALKPRKQRRPTRPTAASQERRLEQKKRHGAIKRERRSSDRTD
jgi:ribosome-associated protein